MISHGPAHELETYKAPEIFVAEQDSDEHDPWDCCLWTPALHVRSLVAHRETPFTRRVQQLDLDCGCPKVEYSTHLLGRMVATWLLV